MKIWNENIIINDYKITFIFTIEFPTGSQLSLEIKVYNLCVYKDSCGYYLYDNIIFLSTKHILFKYIYLIVPITYT